MDGYLQTGLASSYSLSPYASRSTSTSTTGTSPTTAAARLLQPFPPTNKDFECKELHTPDGTFPLACEIYASTIHPQFAQGTQCSVVCNLKPSSSSSSTRLPPPSEFLAMTPVSTDTTTNGTTAAAAAAADSSEDENGLYFGLDKHVKKSMALPIPNATASRHYHHRPIASSSSSSVEQQSGTLRSGTHHGGGFNVTPSTSTTNENASGEKENDFVSTSSLGANSSVGSLSSLFSRNSFRQSHHNRRPRNSLAKTKSSFILRVSMHDQLQKILASRTADDTYVFYNQGTSFIWADGTQKVKEHLCKIVFTKAYPTCHNVNKSTCTGDNMDIIIGFSTGDLIWLDPISSKYSRLNKGGIMCNSAVTAVKWIPGSEDLFMASFKDGTILVLDKDRDDQAFTPDPPSSWADQQMQVSRPPRKSKNNPISHWKASSSSISDFEFSPDGSYVAVVSGDGTLKIIDYHNEHLCDIFAGYYGKLNCVAWSPDGHYLLTGGQDDLVSLWSVLEKRIVARCQGHTSWITSVAFDSTRCDDKVYRFGSVGEDCKLMLWDFSFSALHRPRHKLKSNSTPQSPQDEPSSPLFKSSKKQETKQQQQQPSSFPTFSRFRRRRSSRSPNVFSSSGQILGGNNNDGDNSSGGGASHVPLPTLHPILNKDQVPFLQPITAQTVHADPCSHLSFHKDYITTADRRGRVRMWSRQ